MTTYNGRYIPDFLRILGVVHERDDFKPHKTMHEFYKREKEVLKKLNREDKKRGISL